MARRVPQGTQLAATVEMCSICRRGCRRRNSPRAAACCASIIAVLSLRVMIGVGLRRKRPFGMSGLSTSTVPVEAPT